MHVWRWFHELERTRDMNRFGPRPLTYSEIDAWARLTKRAPEVWEVEAIMAMDTALRFPDG